MGFGNLLKVRARAEPNLEPCFLFTAPWITSPVSHFRLLQRLAPAKRIRPNKEGSNDSWFRWFSADLIKIFSSLSIGHFYEFRVKSVSYIGSAVANRVTCI